MKDEDRATIARRQNVAKARQKWEAMSASERRRRRVLSAEVSTGNGQEDE